MSKLVLENKNNLPKGWVETILDELIVKMSNGTTAKQIQEKTKYPVSRIETISNEFVDFVKVRYLNNPTKDIIEKYKIEQGDILFSNINSDIHLGKTAIFYENQTLIHGMNLLLIRPESRIVIPKFLNFYFKHYRNLGKFISIAQHAVNQSSINQTKLKNLDFIIPPLNEQKRIVVKIEELFSLLESTKEILEKTKILLKQYRSSILKSAFEGKLVPQDPNDEPASMLLEKIRREKDSKSKIDSGMSELVLEKDLKLPQNWLSITFGNYLNLEYGKGLPKNMRKSTGKIPVYGSSGIIGYHKESMIKESCLIVGRKGSAGEVYYVDEPCYAIDTTYYLKQNSLYDLKFLYYLFKSIHSKFIDSSTTIPSLRRDDVYSTKIILPPLNEQKRIVAKIEESFSLTHNSEKLVDALLLQNNLLKTSILKQAFEGTLLPQDPNDEPAEILLEKIKQEKQKIISQSKRGKK